MMEPPHEFWRRHPGLIWSNPEAGDAIHIRAALLRPRFDRLLDIALEFGLDRLRHEWAVVRDEHIPGAERAADAVERILNNIEKGFSLAATRN